MNDAITPVQKTRSDHNPFVKVSSSIFKAILHESSDSIRIDIIINIYGEESIKDKERAVRGPSSTQLKNNVPGQDPEAGWPARYTN